MTHAAGEGHTQQNVSDCKRIPVCLSVNLCHDTKRNAEKLACVSKGMVVSKTRSDLLRMTCTVTHTCPQQHPRAMFISVVLLAVKQLSMGAQYDKRRMLKYSLRAYAWLLRAQKRQSGSFPWAFNKRAAYDKLQAVQSGFTETETRLFICSDTTRSNNN